MLDRAELVRSEVESSPNSLPAAGVETVSEAVLLRALRDNATDLKSANDDKMWDDLKRSLQSTFDMSADDVEFLLMGTVNNHRLNKDIYKTGRAWRASLRKRKRTGWHRPHVALILSEGQAIRTFLLSDVCKKLVTWAELFVLSPHAVEAEVTALGPHAHYLRVPVLRRTRLDYLVGYLGYLQTNSPTSLRFAQRLHENYEKTRASGQPMPAALRIWQIALNYRSPGDYERLYTASLAVFARSHRLKEATDLLRLLSPDMMFNTSVVSWSSRLWTRAAALNGTPLVSNIISWDNMSTKTLLDEFVDEFLIWSEEMDEDFDTSISLVRKKSRVIVGSPQFEPLIQGKGLVPREEFFSRYGLDAGKKLILYTTGSKTLFPREADCLDRLLGHWRDNLKNRANIMVRMHPKDRKGRYEGVMAKFPEVPFTVAGQTLEEDGEWVPNQQDIDLLVNQLHHCDLIVNVASTMTLEGFSIDKPCINIGFSLGLSISARYPMDDYYKSRHYCDVVDSGAARLVADYDQLFAAIEAVIDRHEYDVTTQRQILWKKCNFTRDSSSRIDEYLKRRVMWRASHVMHIPLRLAQNVSSRWAICRKRRGSATCDPGLM